MAGDIFPLKKIVITEKATALQSMSKYVFMVEPTATKNEIKKAVHEKYSVDAVSVQTLRRKPRTVRFKNTKSKKDGYKKAIVTLKPGQTIDIHKA